MPSVRIVQTGDKARGGLAEGFRRALYLAGSTFGPRGRLILLENPVGDPFGVTPPELVREGHLLLEEAEVGGEVERVGLHLVRQVAWEAHRALGDGSKLAAILAGALGVEVLRLRAAGFSPPELEEALEALKAKARSRLWERVVGPEEALEALARQEAGRWAGVLLEALERSGPLGPEEVEAEEGEEGVALETQEGVFWPHESLDRWLGVKERTYRLALFHDPLESLEDLLPLLESAGSEGLLLVAPRYGQEVQATLHLNRRRFPLAAYLAPQEAGWRRERLQDLAAYTGATVLARGEGSAPKAARLPLVQARPEEGGLRLQVSSPERGFSAHLETLFRLHAESSGFARERLEERLRHLLPRVRLRVGSPTLALAELRRRRVKKALRSLALARTHGVLPGGGFALAQLGLEGGGFPGLAQALKEPARWLLANAGLEAAPILASGGTWDVVALRPGPVWDPAPLVLEGLERGFSLALLVARAETVVVEKALEYELPIDSAGPIKEAGIA